MDKCGKCTKTVYPMEKGKEREPGRKKRGKDAEREGKRDSFCLRTRGSFSLLPSFPLLLLLCPSPTFFILYGVSSDLSFFGAFCSLPFAISLILSAFPPPPKKNTKVSSGGRPYHRACFKCTDCNTTLQLGKEAFHDGNLYCDRCHGSGAGGSAGFRGAGSSVNSHTWNKDVHSKGSGGGAGISAWGGHAGGSTGGTSQAASGGASSGGANKFCPECGNKSSGGKFCANCGHAM
jgi:LIM domain